MAINIEKKITAFVMSDADYKEYDKLFTLFVKELGKIKAYAFGIRREHSKKIGALRLFSLCDVDIYDKGDFYTIKDAKTICSFDELSTDFEKMCYASYFIELIDYFSFENIESDEIFSLVYYTFKAIIKGTVKLQLIKLVFELKMLKYQGEYIESSELKNDNETLRYTWDYVIRTEPKLLYRFNLSDDIYELFEREVEREFRLHVNKKFKSLDKIYL